MNDIDLKLPYGYTISDDFESEDLHEGTTIYANDPYAIEYLRNYPEARPARLAIGNVLYLPKADFLDYLSQRKIIWKQDPENSNFVKLIYTNSVYLNDEIFIYAISDVSNLLDILGAINTYYNQDVYRIAKKLKRERHYFDYELEKPFQRYKLFRTGVNKIYKFVYIGPGIYSIRPK